MSLLDTTQREQLRGKHVLVTGGSGFVGSHFVEALRDLDAEVYTFSSRDLDLRDYAALEDFCRDRRVDFIVHAAAYYGGVGFEIRFPGKVFADTTIMTTNVYRLAAERGIQDVINLGSSCIFPGNETFPMAEEHWDKGIPHESVQYYAYAKRFAISMSRAFAQQYGVHSLNPILVNMYGPRDCFEEQKSKVVAALLRRFIEAKRNNAPIVEVWGTGNAVREFLYVKDAVGAVLQLFAAGCREIVNVGSGQPFTIRELAEAIEEVIGYQGQIFWDMSKPDGQPYKVIQISKLQQYLDDLQITPLRVGLRETADWYASEYPAQ